MHSQLLSMLLLLTAAVGAVAVARRFRLPSMLGYLAIGMVLGPHGAQLIGESQEVESFAEFGVVFLMFSIGLEFSLARLKAMRSLVLGFGTAQMLLTAAGPCWWPGTAMARTGSPGWPWAWRWRCPRPPSSPRCCRNASNCIRVRAARPWACCCSRISPWCPA